MDFAKYIFARMEFISGEKICKHSTVCILISGGDMTPEMSLHLSPYNFKIVIDIENHNISYTDFVKQKSKGPKISLDNKHLPGLIG